MGHIKVTACPLDGLCLIEPEIIGDSRGWFTEVYNRRDLEQAGIKRDFVQENQSFSTRGVLRGLHFQKQYPQAKLARVTQGEVFDVAVDLRKDSATYGQWYGVVLSAENHLQFLIPEGFAHGLLVLSDTAVFVYKCTDFYHPGDEGGIAFNDPEVGIVWPGLKLSADPAQCCLSDGTPLSLSEKDKHWKGLRDTFSF